MMNHRIYRKVAMVFTLSFIITLGIQLIDYIKSYILYMTAKKVLITMYKEESSVSDMSDQADIVEYLQGISVDAIRQIFYITATFAFVAGVAMFLMYLSRHRGE